MKMVEHVSRASRSAAGAMAVLAAVLVGLMSVTAAIGAATDPPEAIRILAGASSGDHAWFVLPSDRDPERWRLLHHARQMDGPHYSPQPVTLARQPEAMAASGSRFWLVFPPDDLSRSAKRSAYTGAVERDQALEIYRPSPRDRLQILDALPGTGRLVAMAATNQGPVVLIVPTDETGSSSSGLPADVEEPDVEIPPTDRQAIDLELAEAAIQRPLLLNLRGDRWRELQPPSGIELSQVSRLAAIGETRSQLVLLSADPNDHARTVISRRVTDGGGDNSDELDRWERSVIDLDLRTVLAVETVRGRLVAVVQDQPGERAHLQYIRAAGTVALGELPEPRGRWCLLGMTDGLRMVEFSTRDGAMMRRIDALTGEVSEGQGVIVQPLPAGRMWYTGMLLATAVIAVILVLLVRPSRQATVTLPKGVGVMPPIPRLFALVMDLFPGGVVSVLVLRCSPMEVLRLPILADSPELAMPFLLMMGVMLIHTTVSELIKGTTLGKALLGARVISTEGDLPTAKQVLLRNAVKALILLVPVLVIFALLHPNLRGFNDLVAQTIVVGDVHPSPENGEQEDQ